MSRNRQLGNKHYVGNDMFKGVDPNDPSSSYGKWRRATAALQPELVAEYHRDGVIKAALERLGFALD